MIHWWIFRTSEDSRLITTPRTSSHSHSHRFYPDCPSQVGTSWMSSISCNFICSWIIFASLFLSFIRILTLSPKSLCFHIIQWSISVSTTASQVAQISWTIDNLLLRKVRKVRSSHNHICWLNSSNSCKSITWSTKSLIFNWSYCSFDSSPVPSWNVENKLVYCQLRIQSWSSHWVDSSYGPNGSRSTWFFFKLSKCIFLELTLSQCSELIDSFSIRVSSPTIESHNLC